jgi:hypothetical protein
MTSLVHSLVYEIRTFYWITLLALWTKSAKSSSKQMQQNIMSKHPLVKPGGSFPTAMDVVTITTQYWRLFQSSHDQGLKNVRSLPVECKVKQLRIIQQCCNQSFSICFRHNTRNVYRYLIDYETRSCRHLHGKQTKCARNHAVIANNPIRWKRTFVDGLDVDNQPGPFLNINGRRGHKFCPPRAQFSWHRVAIHPSGSPRCHRWHQTPGDQYRPDQVFFLQLKACWEGKGSFHGEQKVRVP